MKLVDANVLLYAVNRDAEHHERSRTWLDAALNGRRPVGFAWIALLALRAPLHQGRPVPVAAVGERRARPVEAWLAQPPALVLGPTPRHGALFRDLLDPLGSGGNLVNDAHLATLAREHGATIVTFDNDFARFGVSWAPPAA